MDVSPSLSKLQVGLKLGRLSGYFGALVQAEVKQLHEQVQDFEEEERLARGTRPAALLEDSSRQLPVAAESAAAAAAVIPAASHGTSIPSFFGTAKAPDAQQVEEGTDPGVSPMQGGDSNDNGDTDSFLDDEEEGEEGREEEGEEEEDDEEEEEPLTSPIAVAPHARGQPPEKVGPRGNGGDDSGEGFDYTPGLGNDDADADGGSSESEAEQGTRGDEDEGEEEEEEEVVVVAYEDDDGDGGDGSGDGEEVRGDSDEQDEQESIVDDSLEGEQEEEEGEEEEEEKKEEEQPPKGSALGVTRANPKGTSQVQVSNSNNSSHRRRSSSNSCASNGSSARSRRRRNQGGSTNSSHRNSTGSFSSGNSHSAASAHEPGDDDIQSSLAGAGGGQGENLELGDGSEDLSKPDYSPGANRNVLGEGAAAPTAEASSGTRYATEPRPTSPGDSDSYNSGDDGSGGVVGTKSEDRKSRHEDEKRERGWGEEKSEGRGVGEERWGQEADRGRKTSTGATTRPPAVDFDRTSDPAQSARTNLRRGLGTHDVAARGEAEKGNVQPAAASDRPSSPSHRRNLARNLGTRDFGTRDFGALDRDSGRAASDEDCSLVEGRPPPLSVVVDDDDDDMVRGRDGTPVLYRTIHRGAGVVGIGVGGNPVEAALGGRNGGGGGGGVVSDVGGHSSAPLGAENSASVAYDDERQRALLNGGGFFVMHGRFGSPQMRFVWMSRDLGSIYWR